jgi:hypothetical protein
MPPRAPASVLCPRFSCAPHGAPCVMHQKRPRSYIPDSVRTKSSPPRYTTSTLVPTSTAPTSHSTAITTATGTPKNRSYVRPT